MRPIILSDLEAAAEASRKALRRQVQTIFDEFSEEKDVLFIDLEKVIGVILSSKYMEGETLAVLVDFCNYDDVRYLVLRGLLKKIQTPEDHSCFKLLDYLIFCEEITLPDINSNDFSFLSSISPTSDHSAKNLRLHGSMLQKITLILKDRVDGSLKRHFIVSCISVMDKLPKPFLLGDFYAACLKEGGINGVLSLNGVIKLMQNHNFEYPDFFKDLYALIRPENFLNKKYFGNLISSIDLCLSSSNISQIIVASFIKRLARIALFSTPDVIYLILHVLHNALVRHVACRVLIDKKSSVPDKEEDVDLFKDNEDNPSATGALDSTLWEVVALQKHWHPLVAKRATKFSSKAPRIEESISTALLDASLLSYRKSTEFTKKASNVFNVKSDIIRMNFEPPVANEFLAPFCH